MNEKSTPENTRRSPRSSARPVSDVRTVLNSIESKATAHDRENLKKFGITASNAFGVSFGNLKLLGKEIGQNHELAAALWESGWYEARMLASLIDDPEQVTKRQMDRWCRDFDNWGICDTVCFCLFDRVPHAWDKIAQWSVRRREFEKRASFALLASHALHDKVTGDLPFLESLNLIGPAAVDERNFVKKAVNWALRAIGERSRLLNASAKELAGRLAESSDPTSRWIGKDALRQLNTPAAVKRLAARGR